MNFYIADTHFGHTNILKYDNRPFMSVEEMDKAIISNWNKVVNSNDTVFILGDVSWYSRASGKTSGILDKLNGYKVLIRGNHDNRLSAIDVKCFVEIKDYMEFTDHSIGANNASIVLSHYPIPFYKNMPHGDYHFYGHIHNGWDHNMMEHWRKEIENLYQREWRGYNVGCMMPYMNYTPRTFREIVEGFRGLEIVRKESK
jgi:calcineurin-like phosphoesterase family protein